MLYAADVTLEGARATMPAFLRLAGVPWREPDPHGTHLFTLPVNEGTAYAVSADQWDQVPRTVDVVAGERPVRLGLSAQGVGLVVVNRAGAVCAVEGLHLQTSTAETVFQASGHVMLSAVGAATLHDATGLVLLPIEPGTVRVRSSQPLDAVAGDGVDGRGVTRGTLDVQRDEGWISLTLDSAPARSLILLATPEH